MIKEVLSEENQVDPTKLKSTAMSTSQRKQTSVDRITTDDSEFTSQEKGILDQIEGFLSDLAAQPGVDMTKYRSQLERVMKLLQQSVSSTSSAAEQPQPPTIRGQQ
jgi:ElaB/YqjD/DUF883 family membrane-anchored ribosome-binding protein